MTFFVIKFVISSIVILFIFKFIIIVIIIIIIIIISFVVIIVRIIIILTTLIRELIAFRFDMIMFFAMNAVFDEFLNDFIVKIKYNAFLKFNNNDIF